MSALLTTTQGAMATTIRLFEQKGIRSSVKIMVGGAVITESFASEIGADGYAADAGAAVEKTRQLLAE
jgi:5-methyltetrahydrofolate--homocysteine methyltransferase